MVHCQACGITTTARNYGITFHRFPKNENQKCAWINFIKKHKGLHEIQNFKCTMICSQHFEESCFDKTSTVKVRLKPFSIPTIYILRSKYEKISKSVSALTIPLQTENINETSLIDTTATSTSTIDTALVECSDIDISKLNEESADINTLQTDVSQLSDVNDIESPPSNRNVNIESLPSTSIFSHETDISLQILPSDTSKKILKNKIASLGWLLAEKSNAIRKLQKKNWNQQKQIFKLKSVIKKINNKNLI
ncbi:uncharacterized protein [Anoplolepis gracilipes]|uniref:uncharacterized protein n=1 Tax=Anoplolepis gracilipes TaxID=354296 RepID=UPI003BA0C3A8